jgi:hypothetical protein
MKKIFLFSLLALGISVGFAQETGPKPKKNVVNKVKGAGMVFENTTLDFGTIAYNSDGNREFVFTNNGTKPLIITQAIGSCGCTVPTVPKEPIMPGKKGVIGVHYDTKRVGGISKTVTVTSNALGKETMILSIKGTVLENKK